MMMLFSWWEVILSRDGGIGCGLWLMREKRAGWNFSGIYIQTCPPISQKIAELVLFEVSLFHGVLVFPRRPLRCTTGASSGVGR